MSKPRQYVLPLKNSDGGRWKRYLRLFANWIVCCVFCAVFVWDIVDIGDGGYIKTSYGRVNPILSLISYCGTQIVLASACYSTLFLATKKHGIIKSAAMIEALTNLFNINTFSRQNNSNKLWRSLRRLTLYFRIVALLGFLVFLSPLIEPEFRESLWDSQRYGCVVFYRWVFNFYLRGMFFICIVIDYGVKSLFAYLNCFLVSCAEEFCQDQQRFLIWITDNSDNLKSFDYTHYVKKLIDEKEQMNEAFDQVQKTFSGKLLFDMIGVLVALCNDVAWLSVWVLEPGTSDLAQPVAGGNISSILSLLRHLVLSGIDVWCVWIVLRKSIQLYLVVSFQKRGTGTVPNGYHRMLNFSCRLIFLLQHQQTICLFERIVFRRQISTTEVRRRC